MSGASSCAVLMDSLSIIEAAKTVLPAPGFPAIESGGDNVEEKQ